MEMYSCRHRVDAQASKAGGGRVFEQQKQQKQQKKRQQKQTGGSETSLSLDSAGAISIDFVEAHIPTTCAHTTFLAAVCWLFSFLTRP